MKQRALRCFNAGNIAETVEILESLCKLDDSDAELWHMLGIANGRLGLFDEAARCSRRAVSIDADFTDAHFGLAQACMHLGQYMEAVAAYSRVLDRYPDHLAALRNCGFAYYKLGKTGQALALLDRALKLAPGDAEILTNKGLAMAAAGRIRDAEACYRAALESDISCAEASNNLGHLLRRQGRFREAIEAFQHVLSHKPGDVTALVNLGTLLQRCSMHKDAEKLFRRAVRIAPSAPHVRSALLFNLNYHAGDPELVYQEHVAYGRKVEQAIARVPTVGTTHNRETAIRVGYVSPDFRTHSVAYFMKPVLEHHDSSVIEAICYSDVKRPDAMTDSLRAACSEWRNIFGMSDEDVADLIRKDRVDILVDLSGHTAGNRLGVFARKPAPLQTTYLGYPNTTGLSTMDYRLTDAWADPPGKTEPYHTEELVRLPNGFICYQPPARLPDVASLPAIDREYVTFGSFNNLAKITPEVVSVWARLLREIPASRLILKSRLFQDPWVRNHFHHQFGRLGVEEERISLHEFLPRNEHFLLYGDIDIGLDTFPYNGTTTLCESLWMGVPSITLAGRMHAGCVGSSILHQVGLAGWVTETEDAYIQAAVFWSDNLQALSELRMSLRNRMAESPLCNAQDFVRNLEAAYLAMWRKGTGRN